MNGPRVRRILPAKVLVSIISMNRLTGVRDCLTHLFRHGHQFDLVLTNQASTDGTAGYFEAMKQRFKNITVFHETENVGFIQPNDRAFRMAIERGIPYLLLLNDDTRPPAGFLHKLTAPLEMDPDGALCGPEGCCSEISDDFYGRGGRFEYVEGSCLMIKVGLVRSIVGDKLFDPNLHFIYGEDSNLSLRVQEAGKRIHRANFRLHHSGNQTTRRPDVAAKCNEAHEMNRAYNQRRWSHYLKVRRMNYPIVIRRKHALGDVLRVTPIINALKIQRPMCPIYVETECGAVLDRNPQLAGVATRYLPMDGELRINLDMAYENLPGTNVIEAYRIVAGIDKLPDRFLRYTCSTEALHWSVNVFPQNQRRIAIHPGPTHWPGRDWPQERFAQVSGALLSQGYEVILIGAHATPTPIPCSHDLRAKTSIDQCAALLFGSCAFVGIDSFPMHLAMSQDVRVVGLFGCSMPGVVLSEGKAVAVHGDPGQVPCIGQRDRVVGVEFVSCDGACMNSISVDMVLQAVEQIKQRDAVEEPSA